MVRTFWPACNKYKVAVIATVTELPSLFKVHKIWSVDSQENFSNCRHQMSDFMAKKHQIRFRLGLRPLRWGAYSASPDQLAGFKGPTSKEGRKGRVKVQPPCWNFTNTALVQKFGLLCWILMSCLFYTKQNRCRPNTWTVLQVIYVVHYCCSLLLWGNKWRWWCPQSQCV